MTCSKFLLARRSPPERHGAGGRRSKADRRSGGAERRHASVPGAAAPRQTLDWRTGGDRRTNSGGGDDRDTPVSNAPFMAGGSLAHFLAEEAFLLVSVLALLLILVMAGRTAY